MNKKVLFILFFFCLAFGSKGFTQSDYYSVWLDYNHDNKLNEKWSITSDYGYRFRLDYDYFWERLHARSGVVYKMKHVELLAGVAVFSVFEPSVFIDLELRPWQGIKYTFKVAERFKLSNFARLEERFHYFKTADWFGYDYSLLVFRYALTANYALNNPEQDKGKWMAFVGFEPFFILAQKGIPISVSKSRTTIGGSYSISSKTKFRLSYIYEPKNIPILQNREYYSNLIRLSVVQKF